MLPLGAYERGDASILNTTDVNATERGVLLPYVPNGAAPSQLSSETSEQRGFHEHRFYRLDNDDHYHRRNSVGLARKEHAAVSAA